MPYDREHVFGDLSAYTCLFRDCSMRGTLIEEFGAMMNHMRLRHSSRSGRMDIACPLCLEPLEGAIHNSCLHLARHMEEIALSVLPHGDDLEDSDDSDKSEGSDSGSELRNLGARIRFRAAIREIIDGERRRRRSKLLVPNKPDTF